MQSLQQFANSMHEYHQGYYVQGVDDASALTNEQSLAILLGVLTVTFIFLLGYYIIRSIFLGKIFQKAGIESWKAWVPVYNNWTMLEMGGQSHWWAVAAFIPGVGFVALIFMYIAMFNIGKKFGKDDAFLLLAIFLELVWIIWLAVDKSKWTGVKPKKSPTVQTA